MRVKKIISTLFILFVTFSIYGDTTLITISPYSNGEIIISYDLSQKNNDINRWYRDTITFSSGIKIAFMELNQMITRNYAAIGGMVLIDTISSIHYKFSDTLEKIYEHWHPSDLMQGMFTNTVNNPDTNWNEAMRYPDSLAPCDTFVSRHPDNLDSIVFIRTRCIYKVRFSLGTYLWSTNSKKNYNGICYVKDCNNNHIKIQIAEFKTVEKQQGPTSSGIFPDTITLFWAADSCGNGIFKHDPTSKIPAKQTEAQANKVFLSNNNGIPYLYLLNRLDADKEVWIDIYNMKGRKVLQKHITYLKPISLSQLHSGIYLAHISTGREKYIRNFILTE